MDKIPVSAAINESVKLVKSGPFAYSAGIVNAVLRKVATQGLRLPYKADGSFYYSVRYSCPVWLVDLWISTYGEDDACGIMEASLEKAPVHIRVNTNRVTREQLQAVLLDEGVETNCVEHLRDALTIKNPAGIEHMAAYKSRLVSCTRHFLATLLRGFVRPNGNTIFDLCAAPGGKAFTLAQLAGSRSVVHAFDIYESRLALIQSGLGDSGSILCPSALPTPHSIMKNSERRTECCVMYRVPGSVSFAESRRYATKSLPILTNYPNCSILFSVTRQAMSKKAGCWCTLHAH